MFRVSFIVKCPEMAFKIAILSVPLIFPATTMAVSSAVSFSEIAKSVPIANKSISFKSTF
jgi:hypothetical protein